METREMQFSGDDMVEYHEMSEVEVEFASMQDDVSDIGGLKSDMGLAAHDIFLLDDVHGALLIGGNYTDEELDILNLEVTPEIIEIVVDKVKLSPEKAENALFSMDLTSKTMEKLYRMALPKMLADVTSETVDRTEKSINPDYEVLFNQFLAINEEVTNALNKALKMQHLKDMVQIRHAMMDSWYKRFNKWLKTDAYQAYPHKSQAWETYKRILKVRKDLFQATNEKWQAVKPLLQGAWDEFMAVSQMQKEFAAKAPFLWTWLYDLKDSDINTYLTSGDTDDVDEGQLVANNQRELSDILCETHIIEMKEFEREESIGKGFWSYREEKKQERINDLKDEDDCYLEALMASAAA